MKKLFIVFSLLICSITYGNNLTLNIRSIIPYAISIKIKVTKLFNIEDDLATSGTSNLSETKSYTINPGNTTETVSLLNSHQLEGETYTLQSLELTVESYQLGKVFSNPLATTTINMNTLNSPVARVHIAETNITIEEVTGAGQRCAIL